MNKVRSYRQHWKAEKTTLDLLLIYFHRPKMQINSSEKDYPELQPIKWVTNSLAAPIFRLRAWTKIFFCLCIDTGSFYDFNQVNFDKLKSGTMSLLKFGIAIRTFPCLCMLFPILHKSAPNIDIHNAQYIFFLAIPSYAFCIRTRFKLVNNERHKHD